MASIIGVETLQHTNGTTATTIDSSGRVLRPVIPHWHLQMSANQDLTNQHSTYARLTGFQVLTDSGTQTRIGGGCSVSSGTVTVPVAGLYYVSMGIRSDNASEWVRAAIVKNKNGTGITETERNQSMTAITDGTNYESLTTSGVLYLAANDTVEIQITTYGDTSWRVNNDDSHFSGFLIG